MADLELGEQADFAQVGGGEGAAQDLDEREHEHAHREERGEDGPVELAEEVDLGPAAHHQPALSEPDEDDAEEETEEEGVEVDAGDGVAGDVEELAPGQPPLLLTLQDGQ